MISRPNRFHPVIIVGAGASGLALAQELVRVGVPARLLETESRVAEPWRRRHPQLRLNTHRRNSRLPGRGMPSTAGAFAHRNDVVEYLEAYARAASVSIEFGVRAVRLDPLAGCWRIATTRGDRFARHVAIATGRERVPLVPDWSGLPGFAGEVIHAADLGDVRRYEGRRVLVAGAGNSGVDALNHLVRVPTRELRLSVRSGARVLPTRLCGLPLQGLAGAIALLPVPVADVLLGLTERLAFGDLERWGLPRAPGGIATRLDRLGTAPAFDDGFVAALKAGRVRVHPRIAGFTGRDVVFVDGERAAPDVVICATGYRPGLEELVGHLDLLDRSGAPHPGRASGMWFLGMRPRLQGAFRAACAEGRETALLIRRQLQHAHA